MVSSILPVSLSDISIKRRKKFILKNISYEFSTSGITIIVGPNGSGKTSLIKALHGIERISSGAIIWNDDLQNIQQKQSFVFQTPILLRRSVKENILYPLHLKKYSKDVMAQKLVHIMDEFNLTKLMNQPAHLLSGGEKQKLAIARAMITDPELLILDEPCANLDGQSTLEIEKLLHQQAKENVKIIMSTHDLAQAKRLADEIIMMNLGEIVEYGSADNFFTSPVSKAAKQFLQGDVIC